MSENTPSDTEEASPAKTAPDGGEVDAAANAQDAGVVKGAMEPIGLNDQGAAVADIQGRLIKLGLLENGAASGVFDEATVQAVHAFEESHRLPMTDGVDERVWTALVNATYELGDRTLYLRMPHIVGSDVEALQKALGALGFEVGDYDGNFGAYTELALRKFQMNMGLPSDGIAGAYTYATIRNLHHSWEGKTPTVAPVHLGYARAADVLENHAVCLFGTDDFTRDVAARMSNLALATTTASKIVCAADLSVPPNDQMILIRVTLGAPGSRSRIPSVDCSDSEHLVEHLTQALAVTRKKGDRRMELVLPSNQWEDAGESRSAQHFAIQLLDALCLALEQQP